MTFNSFLLGLGTAPEHPPSEPIPHMQAFFDAIDITTVFAGGEAYYLPPVDIVFMPSIERFREGTPLLTAQAMKADLPFKGRVSLLSW